MVESNRLKGIRQGLITQSKSLKEKNEKQTGLKIQPNEEIKKSTEVSLTVDLGSLSPMSDEFISSLEQFFLTPSMTSPTHSDIVKDGVGPMIISDHEEKDNEEAIQDGNDFAFKKKLVDWLRNNNLKFASMTNDVNLNVETFINNENSDMAMIDMG
ncbi:hypothetical protein E6C27_scaffold541G00090 [Cucumis melo var. makuwa]|uniref:Uncharacterized protein n=1 Tax=Cucumis melo var. makuwa TaxID=1194695 RepID=A0A5A7SGB0_CUCMM|nr:hypothetical protein E6C27_scaffold541G00090 [Cucumis melo var. makuwa]